MVTRFINMWHYLISGKCKSSLILFVIIGFTGYAHNVGTIKGQVLDLHNFESLPGANVMIKGTMLGTVSDINGKFEFRNIHEGEYKLVVSFIGYLSVEETVIVQEDSVNVVNISLEYAELEIDPYAVIAERPYSSASTNYIRNIDLEIRPNKSSQDLLKMVPGLIIAQHAGGGKAEQIFLRGFDADHGTDINISVDGIPVNMVSHGHGQGYADLHFLIPETVEEMDVYKGPYFGEFGNLATAGAVQFSTKDILENNLIKVEGGQFNTFKGTILYQPGKGSLEQNGYVAAQYYRSDGPFESPLDLHRMNIFGKYFINISHNSRLTFSAGTMTSAWDASGQIPNRAVKEGHITRYGSIDNLEGGNTSRTNFSLQYDYQDDETSNISLQAYYTDYNFKLFSNFTYYLEDSINGDMIEQLDYRSMHGLNGSYFKLHQLDNLILKTTFGSGYRNDNIDLALWHSPNRIRKEVNSDVSVNERNLFFWIGEEIIFSPKFRVEVELRGDYFTFDVNDHIATITDTVISDLPHASGFAQKGIFSPKLNMVYSPVRKMDIYFNSGSGFHSNDARSVVFSEKASELVRMMENDGLSENEIIENLQSFNIDSEQLDTEILPRALGGEVGIRNQFFNKLHIGVAAWYLYLEKEYVYVGDGGYAELSNPTQRIGFDFEGRLRINSWLWADVDVCFSDGRILGNSSGEDNIPLAPKLTSTGGLTILGFKGFAGSLRYIYIGDRPANESNTVTAEGYTIINLGLSYNWKNFTISMTLENVLNSNWNEAQFDTESRLAWETEPISEIHFTPGNPRNLQFGLSYSF